MSLLYAFFISPCATCNVPRTEYEKYEVLYTSTVQYVLLEIGKSLVLIMIFIILKEQQQITPLSFVGQ